MLELQSVKIKVFLWGVDMFYKYYCCNISQGGVIVGSRIIRVHFFRSPIFAFDAIDKTLPPEKVIVDFKRVK